MLEILSSSFYRRTEFESPTKFKDIDLSPLHLCALAVNDNYASAKPLCIESVRPF
jgi:hypothetical protein